MSLPTTRTARLATWSSNQAYDTLPDPAIQRTKDLFLDWLGCTIAGRSHPAVTAIVKFVRAMGPTSGKSELVDGQLEFTTSAAFAALVNGAASHVVEQDDLHNGSITHPVCYFSFRS
jgi:aconitate decarboxylase